MQPKVDVRKLEVGDTFQVKHPPGALGFNAEWGEEVQVKIENQTQVTYMGRGPVKSYRFSLQNNEISYVDFRQGVVENQLVPTE